MVQAETAGVLFSAHPVTLDPGVMVVEAVYGLGAAVTDGAVTPDSYRIDKASGRLRDLVLGDKRWRITAPDGGPLREEALPAALASKRVLDEHTLARLVALGRRIEQHFGDPRDIEFALVDDGLYVLQARPITHAGKVRAVRPGARGRVSDPSGVVWSNVNVGEALPGVATPFTWSVLSEFAELGFREAFAALGCKVPKDAQLVGNFRGRIYLNLSELTAIAAQVPGLRPSAVLPLGGGAEVEQLERDLQPVSPAGWLLRLPRTVARYARAHVGFGRRLQRHRRAFDAEHARLSGLDLRILPGPSLDETLSDTGKLLDAAGTVMLTGYGGLLSTTVLLQTALRLTLGERAEQVGQALLSAVDEIDSADPGWALLHVAEQYGRDAAAAAALQAAAHDAHALPAGPGRAALASFVAEHGHRGVHEAEIAEPRWSEYPAVLFDLVRLQLGADPAATLRAREQRVATMRAERARVLAALPLAVRTGLAPLLPVIHRQLRERERLRSDVVRVLGLFRRVAIEASRRMRARESEVGIDAAFMLRRDELHAFLRGELRVLAPLVAKRRIQFERECAQPDPPATFVGQPPAIDRTPLGGKRLTGLAASAGRVEGMVRLVRGSEDLALLQPGEILVASSADVGLAPAFLVVGALVTDRGGVLSHACIVAREYGLPAVVNVAIATRALRTGDRVRVDGDAGTVDILQRA
jgi:pyruvate,water dikinase